MTSDRTPLRAWVVLALAATVATLTIVVTSAFLAEYGTTSGSAREGAGDGLKGAAIPLLVILALAVVAFVSGRRSVPVRLLSVAVVPLAVAGVLAAGAQAAVSKYDDLDRIPDCVPAEAIGGPAETMLRDVQQAFADLEHPGRFSGGGSTGIGGCSRFVPTVTYDEAAAHYRDALPAAGWDVTVDEDARLTARRDDLVFLLVDDRPESGMVSVAIEPDEPVTLPPD